MGSRESESILAIAQTLYRHGKPCAECAEICGCSEEDIKKLFKKYGNGKREYTEGQRSRVIELLNEGYTVKEIAEVVKLSEPWVYKIARQNGISPVTEVKREREILIAFVRQYKARGLTVQEIAEKFGINQHFVQKYSKGINPQCIKPLSEREEEAQRYIAERFDSLEYAGGYTHSDSSVKLRCLKCGAVFERSMVTVRHQHDTVCPYCVQEAKKEAERLKAEAKERERQEREAERLERKRVKEQTRAEGLAAKYHPCPVCGTPTTRKKYCSQRCANRVINAKKEAKRRAKIERVLVDKDISLYKLYKRDHGVCYLCGGRCDWSDKEVREDGTTVVGHNYPSIDHVIPLAKGGEHSWGNVRLAHIICNIHKRDN